MGVHMHSDPLRCNVCGVRCKDNQEFQSHLVHGKHGHTTPSIESNSMPQPSSTQLIVS